VLPSVGEPTKDVLALRNEAAQNALCILGRFRRDTSLGLSRDAGSVHLTTKGQQTPNCV
jgi:hypothetical protein